MTQDWSLGPMLAACCGIGVNVWGLPGQHGPGSVHEETLAGGGSVVTVRWSPNRKAVVFGGADGRVHTLANGQVFGTSMPPFSGGISCLRFSNDGKQLFIANTAQLHVLDLKRQAIVTQFSDHAAPITSFSIHPKDELLASASSDGAVLLRTLKQQPQQVVQLWPQDGQARACLTMRTHANGAVAAAAAGASVCLMSVANNAVHREVLASHHSGAVTGVVLSGDQTMFTCGEDARALLWDLRMRQSPLRSSELAGPLTCLSVKEDDLCAALGSADGQVQLLDFRMPVRSMHLGKFSSGGAVTDLHWQPPSRSAAAANSAAAHAALIASDAELAAAIAAPAATSQQGDQHGAQLQQPMPMLQQQLQPQHQQQQQLHQTAVPLVHPSTQQPLRDTTNHLDAGRGKLQGRPSELPLHPGTAPGLKPSVVGLAGGGSAEGAIGPSAAGAQAGISTTAVRPAEGDRPGEAGPGPGSDVLRVRAVAAAAGNASSGIEQDIIKACVEQAVAAVREDVRNLHIELLRQTHMQQMELQQTLGKVLANQERLQAEVSHLAASMEQLARRQKASALSLF